MSKIDSIGIAKQSAFGTKQTTMEYYYDVEGASIDGNPDTIDNITTVGYKFSNPLDMGKQLYKVELDVIPRAASFPRLLSSFYGAPTTSTVDTSAKQHIFEPVTASSLVYSSILMTRKDQPSAIVDLPYDCAGSTLTVSGKTNDFVKVKAQMVAANNDNTRTAPSVTLDATERYKWSQAKLYANINGGGENQIKVNAFEFTYNTALEDDHLIMGQSSVASLPVGSEQTAQIKFTLTEEDASTLLSWYRYPLKTTSRDSIVFRLSITGNTLVGASTQYTGFDIKLWNCEIIDAPAKIDPKNRLRQIDIVARANYDTVNSKFVTTTCWNAVASY